MRLPDRKTFPDIGLLRPYFDKDGKACVTTRMFPIGDECNFQHSQPFNPDAVFVKRCVLTVAEWMEIDRAAQRAARYRMRFVGKLIEHKLFEDVPDWREHRELPLAMPFTHADAWHSDKAMAMVRNEGTPPSFTMLEAASRRVTEALEMHALGVKLERGWPQTVGMFNHPNAVKVRCPKLNEHNVVTVAKLMLMKAIESSLSGPFLFVHGVELDMHLDNDCPINDSAVTIGVTNRQAVRRIGNVGKMRVRVLDAMRCDFLSGSEFGLIHMTKDVVNVRIGQQLIPVQWEDVPGQLSFKVLAVMRAEFGDKGVVLAEQEQ